MNPTRPRPAFSSVQNVSMRKILDQALMGSNGADEIIEEVPQSSDSLKTSEGSKSDSEDSVSLEGAEEKLHNS